MLVTAQFFHTHLRPKGLGICEDERDEIQLIFVIPSEVVNNQIKNTRAEILAELQKSFEKNNAIGIIVKETNELITTAVIDIGSDAESGDYLIHLMDYDLHGYPLETTTLLLTQIDRVIHFNIPFDDPMYVKERRKEKFKI